MYLSLSLFIVVVVIIIIFIIIIRDICKLYVKKYHEKETSINPSSSLLSEIQVSKCTCTCTCIIFIYLFIILHIQRLEDKLDVFNIIHCRKLAKKLVL